MFFFSILFILLFFSVSPIFMATIIIFMALNLSLMASLLVSKWLFITIFMVFLGGMMILFFYILSLSKPVKLQSSSKKHFLFPVLLLAMLAESESLSLKSDYILTHMFNSLSFQALAYLALILLLALTVVVKISENFKGSLLSMW